MFHSLDAFYSSTFLHSAQSWFSPISTRWIPFTSCRESTGRKMSKYHLCAVWKSGFLCIHLKCMSPRLKNLVWRLGGGWWELGEPTHIHIWCRILPDWRRHTVREYLPMEFLSFKKREVRDLIPYNKINFPQSWPRQDLLTRNVLGLAMRMFLSRRRYHPICDQQMVWLYWPG